ncbi:putative SAM-dependent methyltransferase [Phyllobacterium ifriqiyense]|uniref:SAM-dependent methyltransferase n=1 Tax=Phyllobacterium ifriqiyense TaxID=314238 RepID=A0ABU0S7Z3_9HYPH|nr:methyltransferase domain-containing protein [Phyllobacterium ifriqiyense]MDQ0996857.1 putative SAM-dependent methyltransferase [Phyllobacterium ifriqiyense]
MNRTELLLSLFDSSGFGLEVGPSYNPLLPKSKGYNVETVDYADAATLRRKYSANASQIEEVDYVSDGSSLLELIGQKERYDFVFASHVIEHVTDIVRFIQDCEALLKPTGVLVLAVPDKRFCFDTLRPVSTVGAALQAYIEKRTRHTPGMLFDHQLSICTKAGGIVWIEPTFDDVALVHEPKQAQDLFEISQKDTDYHDIHGWQFTPTYFRYFIKTLRALGYIKSGEVAFNKNDDIQLHLHEFYITLSKNAPTLDIADIDLLKKSEEELREIQLSRAPNPLESALKSKEQEISRLRDEFAKATDTQESKILTLQQHLRQSQLETQTLKASSSWKITAPLRFLRSVVR